VHTHDREAIQPEFMERATKMVWCNAATVDTRGRPRSRILHPLWEGDVAWVTTDANSFKRLHLARNPNVSLAYVSDIAKPAYADCHAEWIEDLATKQHVWDLCPTFPEPLGFDPASIYEMVDAPGEGKLPFGVIKLTPYRITLTQWPEPLLMWTK
jgi:hypothetical protein